jgi:hypothetical protein
MEIASQTQWWSSGEHTRVEINTIIGLGQTTKLAFITFAICQA